MLEQDRIEWGKLTAVLDAHPAEILHGAGAEAWRSRDVYAHLARWMEHSNRNIKAFCLGKSLLEMEGGGDQINNRWKKEDEALSFEEARDKAQQEFKKRLRIIRAIPPDKWDAGLQKIVDFDGTQHYSMHRRYIRLD